MTIRTLTDDAPTRNLARPISGFWSKTVAYAVLWSLLIAVTVMYPMIQKGHRQPGDMQLITLICVLGSATAVLATRLITRWLFSHRPLVTRYAATLFLLATLTIGLIAAIFALHFRVYFAQWHDAFPSIYWVLQFIFTTAYAVYLFASSTLHQIVSPINVIILLLCGWLFEPGR